MTESRNRATDDEIENRREQVLRLRFARLSEPEIAERLRVSPATVSRDLQAIHNSWGERFQTSFDVVQELAQAVALFEFLEGAAVRELLRLEAEVDGGAAVKVKCILAAAAMRSRRIEVLMAAGLISNSPVRAQSTLPSAAEIRTAMESARFEPPDMVSEAERTWLSTTSPVTAVGVDDPS